MDLILVSILLIVVCYTIALTGWALFLLLFMGSLKLALWIQVGFNTLTHKRRHREV